MNPLFAHLLTDGPVLTDGAWGTQLQALGLAIGACPDAWNLSHPERVSHVAQAYVEAGSRVILSNTFGANRIVLERHGLADRAREINRAGAALSRSAAGNRARVFASIGPTGTVLALGEVPAEMVRDAFMEQADALAEGGADALVIETMSDVEEATLAIEAARATGLPVVACLSFGAGKAGDRTYSGVRLEDGVQALENAGADAIGSNCGLGPASMQPLCARMRACTSLPLWIKPNAGLPELVDGRAVYRTTPEEYAGEALTLVASGAGFIGGCCGSSPAFVAALAHALGKEAMS